MVIAKLPDYQAFGRQCKLRLELQFFSSLKWEPTVAVYIKFTSISSKTFSTTSITSRSTITSMVSTFSSYMCDLQQDNTVSVSMCRMCYVKYCHSCAQICTSWEIIVFIFDINKIN